MLTHKFSRCLILTFFAGFSTALAANVAAPLSADQILKEVEKRVSAVDESAIIDMTVVEANSASKTREVEIRRKTQGSSHKVMVKIESPASLRGTALLSISDGKNDEQWLYLPSSKQTRRILSSNKSANFLDSELSYEDMGAASTRKFANAILRTEPTTEGDVAVIESKTISGDSSYSRIVTWVPLKTFLVSKIEYYSRDGKLLKTTQMGNYKSFPGGVWRTEEVVVSNVQNHRSTQLKLKDLKLNQGLGDQAFTQTAMEEE
jgi:outer membrane lipoprotein-sorting protein